MARNTLDDLDMQGFTCLHHAVHDRDIDELTYLLGKGANPNIPSRQPHILMTPVMDVPFPPGSTPVQLAALLGHGEMILPLLLAGADPNLKDRDGFAAVDRAISGYLYYAHQAEKKEKSLWRRFNGAAAFRKDSEAFASIIEALLSHGARPALLILPPEFQRPGGDGVKHAHPRP
jgi:hypothetical protein